ncbi:2',5'-phosphodiesterase 12-like isoform X1 [Euwallacea similis]|uniref:2',5'-phosphodiesterase 12-like isoform X1 n=1 Tax=Euwallacea similis TaxID=1736056 RepID=UPI003450F73B
MSNSELKIAYLREFDTSICDIRFTLTVKTKTGNTLEKDVTGFAKNFDTLADLKKSIEENLVALSSNNAEVDRNENCENNELCDLPRKTLIIKFLKIDKDYKDSIKIQDFIKLKEDKILQVCDQKYAIVTNAPFIRVVKLPFSISTNFPVEPITFQAYNLDRKTSKFIWLKSTDQNVWHKIAEGYRYNVTEEDLDHYLKFFCVPYNSHKVKGPVVEAISEYKVNNVPQLPECPFEKRHSLTKEELKGNKIRVVTYNVLADRYVDFDQFDYTLRKFLGVHYRKKLIMKELEGYKADIICLQEVDDMQYKVFYKNQFKKRGYESIFNRKGNCIPEGLVCAFKANRFNLLETKQLVMSGSLDRKQFKKILDLLNANSDVKKEFLRQKTSLQTTILQDLYTNNIAIVGNTHLFYHPDANHIRLLQAFMATLHLGNLKDRVGKESNRHGRVGIIFCGDFNSDVSKSLYDFMVAGTINPEHEDCTKISPSGDALLHHKLRLISASGTPKYTNYTKDYKGCLDYIFVDALKFSVIRQIPVPTAEELKQYVGLPNEVYPSDHLSLVVELDFKSR